MDRTRQSTIEALTWSQARELLAPHTPDLVNIIDAISPDDSHLLYRIYYPFGSKILEGGVFCLPTDGQLYPLHHPMIPNELKQQLGYNFDANPVSMLLNHSAELYVEINDRIIPYSLITPGHIFGLWKIFDEPISHCPPTFCWQMTAGARSLFMIPKISETAGHSRLVKRYGLRADKPQHLYEHWPIFRELVNSPEFPIAWGTDMLCFNQTWFKNLADAAWIFFRDYLMRKAWRSSEFWRNQYIWNAVFTLIKNKRNIKASAHIIDHVKHILSVAVGGLPGFAPAINDCAAPISQLQDIYLNVYELKNHLPIIVHPHSFNLNEERPVYLPIQFSTALELSPKANDKTTAIADSYVIQSVLTKYLEEIEFDRKFDMSKTPLARLPQTVKFNFLHNDCVDYTTITQSSIIPIEDKNFNQIISDTSLKRDFPSAGHFVRSCVRIMKK